MTCFARRASRSGRFRFQTISGVALALAVAAGAAAGEDAAPPSEPAEALLGRAFANLYADDYIQTMELSTQPRAGRGMTRRIQITRKQSADPGKALIRFLEPYEVRRTSVLVLENDGASDDLYVYLPATRLTRHLSNSQRADSFFGTDLAYEDIEPKHIEDYAVERIGAGAHLDAPCALLEVRNRPGFESTYERMVSCIEERRGLILWTDFYVRGQQTKRLEIDPASVRDIDGRYIPFQMTMRDRRRGSATQIATESYEIHPEIPDTLFTTWNLEAGDAERDKTRAGEPASVHDAGHP